MIIVSGWLQVAADDRDRYLSGCVPVVEAARSARGCADFSLSADLVEPDRINVFEQWESVEALELFRSSGPSDEQQSAIIGAQVFQHEIASTICLT